MIVLYDADCGFCRWATAWALRRDRDHVLVAAPIQSPLGSDLLVDLVPGDRFRAAHVIDEDGRRHSGGAATTEVLSALPATRVVGRLTRSLPRSTALLYSVVAARRAGFGRLVGKKARRHADELLEVSTAPTAAKPRVGSEAQT